MIDLDKFKNVRLAVVGDIMLDRWVWGTATRISPEAPVPVVLWNSESWSIGGAGNVAANVITLGGKVIMLGAVGIDQHGASIVITKDDVIIRDGTRKTTVKTRIIAHDHHVVRLDEETTAPLKKQQYNQLFNGLKKQIKKIDGIILSDYGKGVLLDDDFIKNILSLAFDKQVPVFVDTKKVDTTIFTGVTFIVPNRQELSVMSGGLSVSELKDVAKAVRAAQLDLVAKFVLVKLSKDGMVLFQRLGKNDNLKTALFPSQATSVVDVSGAGDTVLATTAMAYTSGHSPHECALLASCAAAIAVGQAGTTSVLLSQLRNFVDMEGFFTPVSVPSA